MLLFLITQKPISYQFEEKGWNPYIAGALSGVVLVLSVAIAGKYFGASTTFVRSAGLLERFFPPSRIENMAYFKYPRRTK